MRELPIPYSAPMVRARRAGLKTQTRRVISRPLKNPGWTTYVYFGPSSNDPNCESKAIECGPDYPDGADDKVRCPFGAAGDRLWVREAWRTLPIYNDLPPREVPRSAPVWYEADGPASTDFAGGRYRHGRFMMRWMSRGLDEVVAIRVERLQDINDDGSLAEGIYPTTTGLYPGSPTAAYRKLWEQINGLGSWQKNPWVWVVVFKVLQ